MNNHGKILYSIKVDGMSNGVNVGVYGIFTSNSGSGKWKYYLLSYKTLPNGNLRLTDERHSYPMEVTYDTIQKYGKEVQSVEDGRKMCDEYKDKWVIGSNDTLQHKREEKLNEILNK